MLPESPGWVRRFWQVLGRGDGSERRQTTPTGRQDLGLSLGKEVCLWNRMVIGYMGCAGERSYLPVLVGTGLIQGAGCF